MSQQNVKSFMREVSENPALQAKINEIIENEREKMFANLVELGNDSDLAFTKEDLSEFLRGQLSIAENGELGDESLETVTGGVVASAILAVAIVGGLATTTVLGTFVVSSLIKEYT